MHMFMCVLYSKCLNSTVIMQIVILVLAIMAEQDN